MSALDAVPGAFLAISLVSLVVQFVSLARITRRSLPGDLRHAGLARTATCRVGVAVVYVGLGIAALLVTPAVAGITALAVFAGTQCVWLVNSLLDTSLARRFNHEREHVAHEDPARGPRAAQSGMHNSLAASQTSMTGAERDIRRIDRDVLKLTAGIVLTLAVVLVASYFVIDTRAETRRLEAQRIAADTERIRVDTVHRQAHCAALAAIRGDYSATGRNAYPGGTARYDTIFSALTQASSTLSCGPE